MAELSKKEIETIIQKWRSKKEIDVITKLNGVESELRNLVDKNVIMRTVLGIDLYRYSKFESLAQAIIPYVISTNLETTRKNITDHEAPFFHDRAPVDFSKDFIDTGDGAFLIFSNPLQAIVFLIYFQANLQAYNSANTHPELSNITRALSVRYCLTFQDIYSFEGKWYGPAIINNARMLAADRLNRLLIDLNTKEWFDVNTNGVETISVLDFADFTKGEKLKDIIEINKESKSLVFPKKYIGSSTIRNVHLSQVGEATIKNDSFAIYSLHLQCYLRSCFCTRDIEEYNYYREPQFSWNWHHLRRF